MPKPPVWLRLATLAVLALGVAWMLLNRNDFNAAVMGARLGSGGRWLPLLFLFYHLLASLLFVPRLAMGAAAGLLFGFWWGLVWSLVGSVAGAAAGFWLARLMGETPATIRAAPRLGPLIARAERGGWRAVLVVRLIPVLPHSLTNYALGLTRVSFPGYLLGSTLGMLPTAIAYVNLGTGGAAALGGRDWLAPALWGIGILALSAFVPRMLRRNL